MKRFGALSILACLFCFACGEVTDTTSTTTTVTQDLTPNADWEFTVSLGGSSNSVYGNNFSISPYSNGTGVPVGSHVMLRHSTSNAIAGAFLLEGYGPQVAGSTYSANVRSFTVAPGPNIFYSIPSTSGATAVVEWVTDELVEISFSGTGALGVTPEEGPSDAGGFDFQLAGLPNGDAPPVVPQPLPFDPTDDSPDENECPAWLWEETKHGDVLTPHSPREELVKLAGDEVKTGYDGDKFVIRFETNLDTGNEFYGGLIALDSEPLVNASNICYPIIGMTVFLNNQTVWKADETDGGSLCIQDWTNGIFHAEVDVMPYLFNDFNPTPAYIENEVQGKMFIHAPMPYHNEAYDNFCDQLDPGNVKVLASIPGRITEIIVCTAIYEATRNYCKNKYDDESEDPDELIAGIECFAAASAAYAACRAGLHFISD